MDKNAYFWRVMDGKLPPPGAAVTLSIRFTHIDADAGTIETTFEAGGDDSVTCARDRCSTEEDMKDAIDVA